MKTLLILLAGILSTILLHAENVPTKKQTDTEEIPTAVTVDQWSPASLPKDWKTIYFYTGQSIKAAGSYDLFLVQTSGTNDLEITDVELLADETVVSKDHRTLINGSKAKVTKYQFKIESHNPEAVYLIRATIRSLYGTDTSGDVRILQK